jgi:ABC-type Co2+ transport system permease subunit
VEQVVVAPDMSNVKLTVNGKAMTLSWDAKNVETQIWMANSVQTEILLTTVGLNGTNTTINGTISGWHCFKMRHKINTSVGAWAIANPADPSDINFCTSIP